MMLEQLIWKMHVKACSQGVESRSKVESDLFTDK